MAELCHGLAPPNAWLLATPNNSPTALSLLQLTLTEVLDVVTSPAHQNCCTGLLHWCLISALTVEISLRIICFVFRKVCSNCLPWLCWALGLSRSYYPRGREGPGARPGSAVAEDLGMHSKRRRKKGINGKSYKPKYTPSPCCLKTLTKINKNLNDKINFLCCGNITFDPCYIGKSFFIIVLYISPFFLLSPIILFSYVYFP